MLECSDNSYYTGITSNLEKRLYEHHKGLDLSCYTYKRRPLNLVFHEIFNNPYDAINAEKQIKGWSRKKKEALINKDFKLLKELAACKNETTHLNFKKPSFDSAQDDK